MNIKIRGDGLEITDAIDSYIKEKVSKLNKFINKEKETEVSILCKTEKGNLSTVEITLLYESLVLRVEESGEDLYACIDFAVDKIIRQLRKNKTRITKNKESHFNKYINIEELNEIEEDEEEHKIVKRKKIELIPMDEEEAILQMELLGHDFFLFKCSEDDKIKVLYKRKDKDYGLIEETK